VLTRMLLAAVLAGGAVVIAQDLRPQTTSFQHVTAAAGASSPTAAAGATVMLWADVTPRPHIHVYAPGAKDFAPPKIVVTPHSLLTVGKPIFPTGTLTALPGVSARVPVYSKTFRITQPVTLAAKAPRGGAVIIAATLSYQACDDAVCYPPASLPLFWRIGVN